MAGKKPRDTEGAQSPSTITLSKDPDRVIAITRGLWRVLIVCVKLRSRYSRLAGGLGAIPGRI